MRQSQFGDDNDVLSTSTNVLELIKVEKKIEIRASKNADETLRKLSKLRFGHLHGYGNMYEHERTRINNKNIKYRSNKNDTWNRVRKARGERQEAGTQLLSQVQCRDDWQSKSADIWLPSAASVRAASASPSLQFNKRDAAR